MLDGIFLLPIILTNQIVKIIMKPIKEKKVSKTAAIILSHASKMFAEHGYDGTIMDELALRADVNKASIYYHFKDKEYLYEQCLIQQFKTVVDATLNEVEKATSTKDKLKQLIIHFARQADKNPQMPAILMRELASGGINMPVNARKQLQRILFQLREILEHGTQEGIFNPMDAFSTHIMIMGSICFFISSKPMRKAIKTSVAVDPTLDEAVNGVANIILNGLLTTGEKQ